MSPSPEQLDQNPGLEELRQDNRRAEIRIAQRLDFLAPSHKHVLRGFVFDRNGANLYVHPIYQGEDQKLAALGGTGFSRQFEVFPSKRTDTNIAWGQGFKKAYLCSETTLRLFLDKKGRLGLKSPNTPPETEAVVLMRAYDEDNLIDQLTTEGEGYSTLATEIDRASLLSQFKRGLEQAGAYIDET